MLLPLYSIAAVVLLSAAELRWPARQQRVDWRVNATATMFYFAGTLLLLPLVSLAFGHFTQGFSVFSLRGLPLWLAAPIYILAADFTEFAFHRAQHAVPVLWRMHALHHSDRAVSASTTFRHYWLDIVAKGLTIYPLLGLIFEPTAPILALYSVISFWHVVAHANLPIDFGRWSWVLNSPAYHRRHHSADPAHYNQNFAGLFPIFDVLAGSYRRSDSMPATGLPTQPRSVGDVAFWPIRNAVGDQGSTAISESQLT
jgi:sterol desaturase/sphingolipid hydroxylase (fatty acid hydroxylase superfamily)